MTAIKAAISAIGSATDKTKAKKQSNFLINIFQHTNIYGLNKNIVVFSLRRSAQEGLRALVG